MCAYVRVCVFVCVSMAAVCVQVCLLCLLKRLLSAYVPLVSPGGVSVESSSGGPPTGLFCKYIQSVSVISIIGVLYVGP